ncbi:UNVERIFIED_CONTAM: hypothetical protein HHA_454400 [Hammondia hammondi]|eukprot:XP_008887934.1 hypothetical protein HHA_454400 [Hammondia hammondi]
MRSLVDDPERSPCFPPFHTLKQRVPLEHVQEKLNKIVWLSEYRRRRDERKIPMDKKTGTNQQASAFRGTLCAAALRALSLSPA